MIESFAVPDFISDFWHYYIAAVTLVSILGIAWFLNSQTMRKLAPGEQAEVLDPTFDDDLQELNNPLPRWWLYMFYLLIAFGIVYLVLYPGLGKFAGAWNWSSGSAYLQEKDRLDAAFNAQFEPYRTLDIVAVAADPKAVKMGENLFLTYCAQCHGSDGQGTQDFPNLTDKEWLWGGDPDSLKQSINNGFTAVMPAMGDAVGGEEGAKQVAHYVLSLGGRAHDPGLAAEGQAKYAVCAGCHGENGKGMAAAGFPDLTDTASRFGNTELAIVASILKGRQGGMPAQAHLGEAKIHLLTAYVHSLSQGK